MVLRVLAAVVLTTVVHAQRTAETLAQDPVEQQRAAVAAAEAEHGAESIEVAAQLVKLGQLLAARSAYDEALPVHRRALSIREARLPAGHTHIDVARVNVASALIGLDDPAAAVPMLRDVCDAGASRAPSRLTAGALTNLGVAECKLGDYGLAAEHLGAAVAMFRAHFPDHPFTSTALQNLAQLRLNQGRVEEARQLLTEVIAGFERSAPRSPRHAMALFGMGMALARAERLDDAAEYLEQSRSMLADRLAPDDPQRRELEFRLGWLCCQRGELAAARAHLERALTGDDATPSTAQLGRRVTLARTLVRLGQPEEAGRQLAFAERIAADLAVPAVQRVALGFLRAELTKALGDVPAAIAAWRELLATVDPVDAEAAFAARSALARDLREHGDHAAAITELLANLRSFHRHCTRVLPAMFEAERLRYVAQNRHDLDLLLEYLTTHPDKLAARNAHDAVLAWKGQVARGVQAGLDRARRSPDDLARLRRLRELASDEAQGRQDAGARRERDRLLTALTPDPDADPAAEVDCATVQRQLGSDAVLIDYVQWRQGDGVDRMLAFVVTRDAVVARSLGDVDAVERAVGQHLLMTSRSLAPGSAALARDGANLARTLVLEPLVDALGSHDRWWICPDGVLATLPFETLPDEPSEETSSNERVDAYLLERYEIGYLQSAAELAMPTRAATAERIVAFGAIDYGAAGSPEVGEPRGVPRPFPPLPETEAELRDIATAAGTAACRLVRGAEADERHLRELAPSATVLHLATHGYFGGDPAGGSRVIGAGRADAGIALAGANDPGDADDGDADDGVLTADEATMLDLHDCRLVVLSSCQSGLGRPFAGESVLGLRRSLHLAGARHTITAMWPVGDRATAALMGEFYRRLLREHEPPVAALRLAQLHALARARAEHGEGLPGRWGAFVCEGR